MPSISSRILNLRRTTIPTSKQTTKGAFFIFAFADLSAPASLRLGAERRHRWQAQAEAPSPLSETAPARRGGLTPDLLLLALLALPPAWHTKHCDWFGGDSSR